MTEQYWNISEKGWQVTLRDKVRLCSSSFRVRWKGWHLAACSPYQLAMYFRLFRTSLVSMVQHLWLNKGMDVRILDNLRKCFQWTKQISLPSTSSAPMEMFCMVFLPLYCPWGEYEDILVATDHLTRYSHTYPEKGQNNGMRSFCIHYGFQEELAIRINLIMCN